MRRGSVGARGAVLVAALLLVTGACGGGGKKTSAGKGAGTTTTAAAGDATSTTSGPGGASGAGAAATTVAPGKPGSPATTAAPGGAKPTSPAGGTTPPTAGSQGGNGGNTTGQASPPPYQARPQTAPGHYHYAISGTSSFGNPPPGSDLTVDPPQGSSQHSKVSTPNSTTDTTVDYEGDGVHLIDLTTTTQTGFGPPYVLRFHPTPPPLLFRAPFTKGDVVGPFDMTSDDGKVVATVKVTIQELNDPTATGDGAQHPAIRAEVDSNIHCAPGQQCQFEGTINSTRWIGYDGLTLKDHSTTDGSFSGTPVKSDTTAVLDKASPS